MTSLLVALLGQARVYVVLGRSRLLPPWLAAVHPGRETPMHATIFTGITSGEATSPLNHFPSGPPIKSRGGQSSYPRILVSMRMRMRMQIERVQHFTTTALQMSSPPNSHCHFCVGVECELGF